MKVPRAQRRLIVAALGVMLSLGLYLAAFGHDVRQPRALKKLEDHTLAKGQEQVLKLEFSPNGQTLAIVWRAGPRNPDSEKWPNQKIQLWSVSKQQFVGEFSIPHARFSDLAFDSTGENLAVASLAEQSPAPVSHDDAVTMSEEAARTASKAVEEGRRLSEANGDIRLWNIKQQRFGRVFADGRFRLAFASGEELWMGTDEPYKPYTYGPSNILRLHSTKTGKQLKSIRFDIAAYAVDVSPNAQFVATSNGGDLQVWNMHTSRMQYHVRQTVPERSINTPFITFTLGGKAIAWTYILAWNFELRDVSSGMLLWKCNSISPVYALATPPQGNLLATGHKDHLVRIWDLKRRKLLHVLKGHNSEVSRLAFSPDGSTLASGSYDGTVKLWHIK
ncbi:MAG TPA: WD40 repeat domain-containing protein [Abditibacteriaceae bacterium]|jgi:WD40 repeat protein